MQTRRVPTKLEATLGLVVVALLWGITFPLIRAAVQTISPSYFVAVRFSMAAFALAPFVLLSRERRKQVSQNWSVGLLLGAVLFITFVSQTVGLQTVPAPRAAFLTGTYVLFVPLFSLVFHHCPPSPADCFGAVLATLGLYFLVDPSIGEFTDGDWWVLVCAIGVALHLHSLQFFYRKGLHELSLAFLQVAGVAVYAVLFLPMNTQKHFDLGHDVLVGLGVCALLVTVGTFWLHSRYQKALNAEKAAVIFALEPVFASFFGYWILGEELTGRSALGAGLIASALVLNGLLADIRWPILNRRSLSSHSGGARRLGEKTA